SQTCAFAPSQCARSLANSSAVFVQFEGHILVDVVKPGRPDHSTTSALRREASGKVKVAALPARTPPKSSIVFSPDISTGTGGINRLTAAPLIPPTTLCQRLSLAPFLFTEPRLISILAGPAF